MGLSGETVSVCGWWANQSSVADGCMCSSYLPARTGCGGREGERQHRRHCVSLQLLSSDTRLIVHLNTSTLSAARQPVRSPRRPACPPASPPARLLFTFIISQAGLHDLPGAQTAAEEVTKSVLHFKCLSQIL